MVTTSNDLMPRPDVEWVALSPGRVLVATAAHCWIHTYVAGSPFAAPMTGPGSIATTRNLLDGAARAGWAAAPGGPAPQLTPARWAYHLAGLYHTTHATPRLMRAAAERFAAAGRARLAAWASEKAREEEGHDLLALRDLRELGHDAEALVQAIVPPIQAALVRYCERHVEADDPVGCVGYIYSLERHAVEVGDAFIARVEASLPAGVRATRCLRVHSGIGVDRRHVEEGVELIATLSAGERARIAVACHETAAICYAPRGGEPLGEEVLQRRLAPLRVDRRIET